MNDSSATLVGALWGCITRTPAELRGVRRGAVLRREPGADAAVGDRWHCCWAPICEDIWSPAARRPAGRRWRDPDRESTGPPTMPERAERVSGWCGQRARKRCSDRYANCVGGQDELVFDGDSLVVDAYGTVIARAPQFTEELFVLDVAVPSDRERTTEAVPAVGPKPDRVPLPMPNSVDRLSDDAAVYEALVTGLRDYVTKNGFKVVVVGSSGGIDLRSRRRSRSRSGTGAVHTITMPCRATRRRGRSPTPGRSQRTLDAGSRWFRSRMPSSRSSRPLIRSSTAHHRALPRRTSRLGSGDDPDGRVEQVRGHGRPPPATSPRWRWGTRPSTATWPAAMPC